MFFTGTVAEAIASVKQQGRLLLVSLQDDSENSRAVDALWEDAAVRQAVSDRAIALRLQDGTVDCNNFRAVFPVPLLPTIYILASSGTPQALLHGVITKADLLPKLTTNSTPEISANSDSPAASEAPTRAQPTAPSSAASGSLTTTNTAQVATPATTGNAKPKAQAFAASKAPVDNTLATSGGSAQAEGHSQSESTLRAPKTPSKSPVAPNSTSGNNVGATSSPAEQKRISKTAPVVGSPRTSSPKAVRKDHQKEPVLSQEPSASHEKRAAYLLFRLPDGGKVDNKFESTDTLRVVRQFVAAHCPGQVSLSSMHPRTVLSEEDGSRTVAELGLCPSAIIIVTRSSAAVATALGASPQGSADSILVRLQGLVAWCLRILDPRNWFPGSSASNTVNRRLSDRAAPPGTASNNQRTGGSGSSRAAPGTGKKSGMMTLNDLGQSSSEQNTGGPLGQLRKRLAQGQQPQSRDSTAIHRRGNIASFGPPGEDEDDKQRFWNGNSTQFGGDNK